MAQFYDPPLRCLTFQDFQLAHTLEEFEHIVGINMKNKVTFSSIEELPKHEIIVFALHMHKRDVTPNLETKGNTQGFSIKILLKKALAFADAKNWEVCNTVLALSIYDRLIP